MANRKRYGFKFVRGINGSRDTPEPEKWPVATGYQAAVNGGGNVDLNVGDVVQRLSTGYISLAEGTESASAADIPLGVIVGFAPYFDGTVLQPTGKLPGGTAYGTNFDRQSFALVVPIQSGIWQVNCDENSTAATYAAYLALVGERVEMVNSYDATNLKADPQVDISTHATTSTLMFTIYGLSPSLDSADYAGTNFSLLLTANRYADAANTAGV